MAKIQISLSPNKKIIANLKTKNGLITHYGVGRMNSIGWSRLYMHLWKQAQKELNLSDAQVIEKQNELEVWILEALNVIKNYNNRINPDNINYEDVKHILSKNGKVTAGNFIDYDPNLKHTDPQHTDDWFYDHATKYGPIFSKEITELSGGFTGWWKVPEENEIIENSATTTPNETNPTDTKPEEKENGEGLVLEKPDGRVVAMFIDEQGTKFPQGTEFTLKDENGESKTISLQSEGFLTLNQSEGTYYLSKKEHKI